MENGTTLSGFYQGLTVFHTHVRSDLYEEAKQAVNKGEIVTTTHPLLAAIHSLLGLRGHSDTGAIKLPPKFVHKGAKNWTFRPQG